MQPIHLALVIGIDESDATTPGTAGPRRLAAERAVEQLSQKGAFVRCLLGSDEDIPLAEPATQVEITKALDELVAGAVAGARISLIYCGITVVHPERGTLLRGSKTPYGATADMWSVDEILARFEGCPGPITLVVDGTAVSEEGGFVAEEVEWNAEENGIRIFEILDMLNNLIGYVVITGTSYNDSDRWDPGKDYWIWTGTSAWLDHFQIRWSLNQDDDSRFNGLSPDEVYTMTVFSQSSTTPPTTPAGKLYRVTRKVGSVNTTLNLYMHHFVNTSGPTTEWWASSEVLTTENYINFPSNHVHIFDKITSPPQNPMTNRHIAMETSG